VPLLLLVCVTLTITGQPRNSVFIRSVAEISRHSVLSGGQDSPNISETTRARKLKLKMQLNMPKYSFWV